MSEELQAHGIVVPLPDLRPFIGHEFLQNTTRAGYTLKNEFHLTIANAQQAVELANHERSYIASEIGQKCLQTELAFDQRLYCIDKQKYVNGVNHPRESLVALFEPDKAAFIANVVNRLMSQFHVRTDIFPHVTLFTRPDTPIARRGIGISSREEWRDLKYRIYSVQWLRPGTLD